MTTSKNKAVLLLADGTFFNGFAVGKIGTTTGEICFNTGLTGYQEIYTDPSYSGQIIVHTNVHIGNYGAKKSDTESSKIQIAGMVCRNFASHYSRNMADQSLQAYLEENELVGIEGIDTRALVQHIRNKGAMNAVISSEIADVSALKALLDAVPSMEGLELSSRVTTDSFYTSGNPDAPLRVAVLDYGVKGNIVDCLVARGAFCGVFPAHSTLEELLGFNPDGVMLSNGPGDPATMDYAVATIKSLLDRNMPLFGICLGNQLLGRACGMDTFKMHNGHRGMNHPVLNHLTGLSEITSQNHGFSLVDVPSDQVEITHKNLNDGTIEGIRVKGKPAFSVQYHPESSPGPHDSRYLFDDFIQLILNNKN
jgi:carbamoyl-phosphate synthase small subunit